MHSPYLKKYYNNYEIEKLRGFPNSLISDCCHLQIYQDLLYKFDNFSFMDSSSKYSSLASNISSFEIISQAQNITSDSSSFIKLGNQNLSEFGFLDYFQELEK